MVEEAGGEGEIMEYKCTFLTAYGGFGEGGGGSVGTGRGEVLEGGLKYREKSFWKGRGASIKWREGVLGKRVFFGLSEYYSHSWERGESGSLVFVCAPFSSAFLIIVYSFK
jgi:hypothetical protein